MLKNKTIAAFISSDTSSAAIELAAKGGLASSTRRASSWRSRRTVLLAQYRYKPPTGWRVTRFCCTSFSKGSLVAVCSKLSSSSTKQPLAEFSTNASAVSSKVPQRENLTDWKDH